MADLLIYPVGAIALGALALKVCSDVSYKQASARNMVNRYADGARDMHAYMLERKLRDKEIAKLIDEKKLPKTNAFLSEPKNLAKNTVEMYKQHYFLLTCPDFEYDGPLDTRYTDHVDKANKLRNYFAIYNDLSPLSQVLSYYTWRTKYNELQDWVQQFHQDIAEQTLLHKVRIPIDPEFKKCIRDDMSTLQKST